MVANFVFVMLMTLPPHSGQSLLRGKENPTSATNSISSEIEGWKIPVVSVRDMKGYCYDVQLVLGVSFW